MTGDGNGAPGAHPSDAAPRPILYRGRDGGVFSIALANALLNVATLGFYRFWGKTRLRRYLWSSIRVDGEPLEYTGTGRELFYGFLVVCLIGIPVLAAVAITELWFDEAELFGLRPSIALYLIAILFLMPYASYRARRYRLARTALRGIRFVQGGSAVRYAVYAMGYNLLALATLFILAPLAAQRLERYTLRNTWFGDRCFAFAAPVRPLFWHWLKALALALPTLGLSLVWYRARQVRWFAANTALAGVRFRSTLAGGALVGLWLAYFGAWMLALVIVAAFGLMALGEPVHQLINEFLAQPLEPERAHEILGAHLPALAPALAALVLLYYVATRVIATLMIGHRGLRLAVRTLAIEGSTDLRAIAQAPRGRQRWGEGLMDALDVGGI